MSILINALAKKHKLKQEFVEKIWRSCKKDVKKNNEGKKNYADAVNLLIDRLGLQTSQCLPNKNEAIILNDFKLEELSADSNLTLFKVLSCENDKLKKYFNESSVMIVKSSDLIQETTSAVCVGSGPQQPAAKTTEPSLPKKKKKKKSLDLSDFTKLSTDEDIDSFLDDFFMDSIVESEEKDVCGFCSNAICECAKYVKESMQSDVEFKSNLTHEDIDLIAKSADYKEGEESATDEYPVSSGDDKIELESPPKIAKHSGASSSDVDLENVEDVSTESSNQDEFGEDFQEEEEEIEDVSLETDENPEDRESIEYLNQSQKRPASLSFGEVNETLLSRANQMHNIFGGEAPRVQDRKSRKIIGNKIIESKSNVPKNLKERSAELHNILFLTMQSLGFGLVSEFDPQIERQIASYQIRKKSSCKSFKRLRRNYKGKVIATRKPFSTFILFSFDDDSSEYVQEFDAEEYCIAMGMKNSQKFLDYVKNYLRATITL